MKCNVSRSILLLLAGTMCIGCGTTTSEHVDDTQGLGTVEETNVLETESITKVDEPLYVEYDDTFFTWCDPEKKVYTSLQNVDKDIYARVYNNTHTFVIMTAEHVNPEEIEIIIPIESDYFVKIKENTDVRTTKYQAFLEVNNGDINGHIGTESIGNAYPYILYHCYQDTDWNEMLKLYLAKENADNQQSEMLDNGISFTDPEYEALGYSKEVYDLYLNQYRETYKALMSADLPEFYYYEVTVQFGKVTEDELGNVKTENFEQIEIQIGEKTYTQDIGQIRIHEETVWDFEYNTNLYWEELKQPREYAGAIGWPSDGVNYPWGDCIATTQAYVFQTKQEVTVTKSILFAGPSDIEILGARVRTKHAKNGEMDFYWDLQSPIRLEENTVVSIDIFWKDPNLTKLEYSTMLGLALEYETGEETVQRSQFIEVNRDESIKSLKKYNDYSEAESISAPWFRYAVVFDGLNLKSYINDFYRPVHETWKEEIPW